MVPCAGLLHLAQQIVCKQDEDVRRDSGAQAHLSLQPGSHMPQGAGILRSHSARLLHQAQQIVCPEAAQVHEGVARVQAGQVHEGDA